MSKFLMSLIVLVAMPIVHAQKSSFFVLGADPQMGFYSQNKDMKHEEANTAYFVASVNRLKPSFVLICGDLVNAAGNLEQIKRYKEIMQQIDPNIPVHYVAGNHDVAFGNVARTLAVYRKEFGPDYYVFDSGEVRNIVLDSTLIKAPQDAPEEAKTQKQWLIDELERARKEGVKEIFIFQHIPYFLENPEEPDQYYNIPATSRKEYLALFQQYGIHYIFAGHYHRNAEGHDGNIDMITTGPIGLPFEKTESGFRIVRLAGDLVQTQYYDLGKVPDTIDPTKDLP